MVDLLGGQTECLFWGTNIFSFIQEKQFVHSDILKFESAYSCYVCVMGDSIAVCLRDNNSIYSDKIV